jgi:hypothetical protein
MRAQVDGISRMCRGELDLAKTKVRELEYELARRSEELKSEKHKAEMVSEKLNKELEALRSSNASNPSTIDSHTSPITMMGNLLPGGAVSPPSQGTIVAGESSMEGPASASFTDGSLATGVISTSRQLALLRNCSDMAALSAQIRGMSPAAAAAAPATPSQSHYTLPPTPAWGGLRRMDVGGKDVRMSESLQRHQQVATPSHGITGIAWGGQNLQVSPAVDPFIKTFIDECITR